MAKRDRKISLLKSERAVNKVSIVKINITKKENNITSYISLETTKLGEKCSAIAVNPKFLSNLSKSSSTFLRPLAGAVPKVKQPGTELTLTWDGSHHRRQVYVLGLNADPTVFLKCTFSINCWKMLVRINIILCHRYMYIPEMK